MKKKIAKAASYIARNALVAAGIRETLPTRPAAIRSGNALTFSIRMYPKFNGRLIIRKTGDVVTVQCKDEASKAALLDAIQNALARRDLDERHWTNPDGARKQI